jgi:protein-L-isoaspartate(D-aspartate) O-methyltransferase
MVRQLQTRGIRDARVIAALRKIPRDRFVEPGLALTSHDAGSLPIGREQTISQPYVVAYMTEQLQVGPEHTVLEVGTGSGYQAAVLAELAREVFTVERHAGLQEQARRALAGLRYANVHYRVGDGAAGWPEPTRFDRILVTAAGPEIPLRLIEQLAENGRLVMPIEDRGRQHLVLAVKLEGRIRRRYLAGCGFVPLVTDSADGR